MAPPANRLDVWYITDQSLCNFDCRYCNTAPLRTNKSIWASDGSAARFDRIMSWLGRLPYDLGIRIVTMGEPFVSEEFLRGVARTTREPNPRFVELLTNGSLLKSRLPLMIDEFGADVSKLSLWITYHHTGISIEKLIEGAMFAQERGVFVVVNALFFPDNADLVERLMSLCKQNGLRTNVDLGHAFRDFEDPELGNPMYGQNYAFVEIDDAGSRRFKQLSSLAQNQKLVLTSVVAAEDPIGLGCSAGSGYIFVNWLGDVYPCRPYAFERGHTKLGSALDPGFVPALREAKFAPCTMERGCLCKEDYVHLEIAHPGPPREKSLGYWPAGATSETPSAELVNRLERLHRARKAGVLKVIT